MAELSINTLVMMVILIIAILAAVYFITTASKTSTQTQNLGELLSCCSTYTGTNCEDKTISCGTSTIGELATKLGLTDQQLNDRCGCPK